MSIEMYSMRNHRKRILSLFLRVKVSPCLTMISRVIQISALFLLILVFWINRRLSEIVQCGNNTHNTGRYSFEIVRNWMSKDCGKLLCTQQKWLLQWAYIPSCYQRIYASNWWSNWNGHGRWINMGRWFQGRIPSIAATWQTLHIIDGQRRTQHQRQPVLYYCITNGKFTIQPSRWNLTFLKKQI